MSAHALYYWTAALAGLLVWYGVLTLLSPHGSCRWLRLLPGLLAGDLSFRCLRWYMVTVHPLVEGRLKSLNEQYPLAGFIADVGFREETCKLIVVLPCVLWARKQISGPPPLLIAAAVGLGFAFEENRWFFGTHAEPTLLVGRLLGPTLLHVALTGVTGAALAQWLIKGGKAWIVMSATLLGAAILHGYYDWAPASGPEILKLGGTSALSLLIVASASVGLFWSYRQRPWWGHAQHCAASWWLAVGFFVHLAAAIMLVFAGWGTMAAIMVCLKECGLFLPIVACVLFLLQQGHARKGCGSL